MKWHGISVFDGNFFQFTRPRIYDGTTWQYVEPRIYLSNQWKTIGAACTNMLWLQDDNGDFVNQDGNPDGDPYLVREAWEAQLIDENDQILVDSQDRLLVVGED